MPPVVAFMTRQRLTDKAVGDRDTAEDADEQGVVGDGKGGQQVGEQVGEHDHQAGVKGILFADEPEAQIDGEGVEDDVDQGVGQFNVEPQFKHALQQQGQAGGAARIQPARADKRLDVDRHDEGSQTDDDQPQAVFFEVEFHSVQYPFC